MVVNAEEIGTSVTASKDPRITGIWRILRRTKMDELPQLMNVLKGDMGLVGPRPDVPEIVNNYNDKMKMVLEVRPGITGNAALYLRNEEDLLSLAKDPEPMKKYLSLQRLNLQWNMLSESLFFDFSILIRTLWALTSGRMWPTKEHPIVSEIKQDIEKMNKDLISGH